MIEQLKQAIKSVKEWWGKLEPKKKKIFLISAGGLLALALAATAILNLNKETFVVLYSNMSQEESREVYSHLRGMGVEVKENETGQLMIPESREDEVLLTLAEKGFPKSTTSYGLDTESSLTTTDYERKEKTKLQLQEKIAETIRHMTGVKDATVILNFTQDNGFAWGQDTSESSASVSITMISGYNISPDNVTTIKNLVATSVKNLKPQNVTVVDAATMLELQGRDSVDGNNGWDYLQKLGFETQLETKYETKIRKLLMNAYGADGVTVSAKVVLDYDKMITESVEYIPDNNGRGVTQHIKDDYSMSLEQLAGGIAGEENNTDIPVVVDSNGDGTPEYVNHLREVDYVISYIKKQVEKDSVPIKESTISVTVNDSELTDAKKEALTDSISKAVNIPPTNIAVYSFVGTPIQVTAPTLMDQIKSIPLVYIIGAVLLLILIVVLIIVLVSRKKKEAEEQEEALEQGETEERDPAILSLEEMEENRKKLREMAEINSSKENAVTEDVRSFAVENPEITAALIRAWLKEDE